MTTPKSQILRTLTSPELAQQGTVSSSDASVDSSDNPPESSNAHTPPESPVPPRKCSSFVTMTNANTTRRLWLVSPYNHHHQWKNN
jgi:hypothetical protein